MMRTIWAAALATLLTAGGASAKALFDSDEPLAIGLRGPFSQLSSAAPGSSLVVDGSLTVGGVSLPVKLSPRGITRRAKDVCAFAPVKVTFDKPGDGPFKGQKGLKLVSHCRTSESFQQYVLLEYAAYRMYELISPASLHTRLVKVDYADAGGKPIISRMGYFIEAIDDAAKRNGGKELKTQARVPTAQISAADAARFAVFQYMIGNLDWAMNAGPPGDECCHNAKLIQPASGGALVPVPYDFDFSGLVDAPYATPPAAIPLPNVRVRRYHGFCRSNPEAVTAIAAIAAKRAAIVGVLDTVPGLEPKTKAKASAYLAGFFDQAGDPAQVQKILKGCSG